jgi:hypothetical protein
MHGCRSPKAPFERYLIQNLINCQWRKEAETQSPDLSKDCVTWIVKLFKSPATTGSVKRLFSTVSNIKTNLRKKLNHDDEIIILLSHFKLQWIKTLRKRNRDTELQEIGTNNDEDDDGDEDGDGCTSDEN